MRARRRKKKGGEAPKLLIICSKVQTLIIYEDACQTPFNRFAAMPMTIAFLYCKIAVGEC